VEIMNKEEIFEKISQMLKKQRAKKIAVFGFYLRERNDMKAI